MGRRRGSAGTKKGKFYPLFGLQSLCLSTRQETAIILLRDKVTINDYYTIYHLERPPPTDVVKDIVKVFYHNLVVLLILVYFQFVSHVEHKAQSSRSIFTCFDTQ